MHAHMLLAIVYCQWLLPSQLEPAQHRSSSLLLLFPSPSFCSRKKNPQGEAELCFHTSQAQPEPTKGNLQCMREACWRWGSTCRQCVSCHHSFLGPVRSLLLCCCLCFFPCCNCQLPLPWEQAGREHTLKLINWYPYMVERGGERGGVGGFTRMQWGVVGNWVWRALLQQGWGGGITTVGSSEGCVGLHY